ncbi:MAG: TolC family protein [Bacteroidaceae bacterium]|nr:TolC family protein [Bacteroidaceae bacterium]
MKKYCLSSLCALFLFASGLRAQDVMEITLAKAIEIALAENPTIKVAEKDVQLKRIADAEAWQSLLPTLSATGTATQTLKPAVMKFGGGQSFQMGEVDDKASSIVGNLNLPIFAPAVYANMKMTKEDVKLAQEKARNSKLDLVNQVTKAYFSYLLSIAAFNVMDEAYNVSNETYKNVSAKYEVGKVSEYDKITAEVQMRNMSSSRISAEGAVTLAALRLKVLMGVTADITFKPTELLQDYSRQLVPVSLQSEPGELLNNSSLRQLDFSENLLRRTLSIQKTSFMPTLSFQLSGQYQGQRERNWDYANWDWVGSSSMSLVLNIPIFTASNFTKLKSTRLKILQLADTRENTVRQLEMNAAGLRKNMQTSYAEIESDKEAINQAQKAVNISSKRYEVGRGTVLDMNQSQLALTQSMLTYAQAIYDYLSNKADLDMVIGKETYIK